MIIALALNSKKKNIFNIEKVMPISMKKNDKLNFEIY